MIQFFYNDITFTFKRRNELKVFIKQLFIKENKTLQQLTYVFCTDEYLLGINQSALNHNYYTDIITFDLSEQKNATIGEIYISIERVKDNAATYKVNFNEELHRVIFHGALHLCGYKDKTKEEIATMRKKEQQYLSQYIK